MKTMIFAMVLLSSTYGFAYDGVIVRCARLSGVLLTNVEIKREIVDLGTPKVRFLDSLEANITMIDRGIVAPLAVGSVSTAVLKNSIIYQGQKFSLEVTYDYNTFKLVDTSGAYTVEGVARLDIKSESGREEIYELDCTKYDQM